jgi:hypothetical protein
MAAVDEELDVLSAFGPKPGAKGATEESSEYEDEFSSAAADAFPELADDPARLEALKQAIKACVREDKKTATPK